MQTTPRRKDRTLAPADAERLFDAAEYAFLTLVSDDEYPYSVPVNFAKVGQTVYIHGAPQGRKIAMVSANPHAQLAVVASAQVVPEEFSTNYESAMAFGKIFVCADESEKLCGLRAIAAKYCRHLPLESEKFIESAIARTAVFRFEMEGISGKRRGTAAQ